MPKKDMPDYGIPRDNRRTTINTKLHPPAWLRAWGPALVWMGILFYLSSRQHLPQPPDPLLNTIIRKGGHMVAFALLALFYRRGLRHENVLGTALICGAWLLTALYAASDEFHQGFTPGREPTVMDWCIDMTGATLALALQTLWQRKSGRAESAAQ
ncbi:MAG: VanZ like family protein [Chloroflexi bacterium ADurb.Bin360]|nr:MAG: VanZ like family protein [Chloroflexi bacterium ADurb.Bin360]